MEYHVADSNKVFQKTVPRFEFERHFCQNGNGNAENLLSRLIRVLLRKTRENTLFLPEVISVEYHVADSNRHKVFQKTRPRFEFEKRFCPQIVKCPHSTNIEVSRAGFRSGKCNWKKGKIITLNWIHNNFH